MHNLKQLIYDYARGKKQHQTVATKEYKRGYKQFTVNEVKGRPFASFTAGLNSETNKFHIGVVVCAPAKTILVDSPEPENTKIKETRGDVFTKLFGREESTDRALSWDENEFKEYLKVMPIQAVQPLVAFYDRCRKYYQGIEPAYDYLALLGFAHNDLLVFPTEEGECTGCFCGSGPKGHPKMEEN